MFEILDRETIILILASVTTFAAVVATALPFLRRDDRADRISAVTQHRQQLSQQQLQRIEQQVGRRREQTRVNRMRTLLERFRLANLTSSADLKIKLAMAGMRKDSAVVTFVFTRFAVALGAAVVTFSFVSISTNVEAGALIRLVAAGSAGIIGFYLPSVLVQNLIKKRQDAIRAPFPDALDLLVICVEGGLSLDAALARVAEESMSSSPVLAEELGLLTAELTFLGDRRQALTNFAERTGLPAARSLTTAMIQSERYGTAVSVALKVLSQESREERTAIAEKKAGALPALLTVPMIVFFMPSLAIVILAPPFLSILVP